MIDREGKLEYKGGGGTFGPKPGKMEQSLVMPLLDQTAEKVHARPPGGN